MTTATQADAAGKVNYEFTHTINGKAETSKTSFDVINPATATAFAQCPDATKIQLNRAVASARRAFPGWAKKSFEERRAYLHKFAAAVRERSEELAALITREQGKPLSNALREMAGTANSLEQMANIELKDEVLRDDGKNRISMHFRPMGVVGAITPWNVPVGLASHKIAQALYAGNTLVLKPSPYTPLSTLLLGELSRDILPHGVFNVVGGGNAVGQWLTKHPGIDKISFTGSVATGKRVMESSSGTLKRVTLELGGNDPAIMLDDVDIAGATAKIFNGAFGNCGQICMAVKRVYVPEDLYEPVLEAFAQLARNHRVGEGFEPDVQMGPLQNKMQYDKVLDVLEDTKRQPGVRIVAGGHPLNRPGYFLEPTIVGDIGDNTRLVTEEQFGPILPVLKYTDLKDALARANDTTMGLAASVWTKDIEKGAKVAAQIQAGTVWVNHHVGSEADIPFGGFKQSGLGREHGVMGLQAYMEPQIINVPLQQ
ncbi:aldehyde dehydrogenase family protein [Roseiarcaceae bacterium H3SJ34-1]|uniref:aldehyde dehydrogenase family protein n=1 Tax=Terripilifer ovatus TaxID=3032367 RepID=UPI003AB982FF|nr:aldehyde dehydrogenase family protein [Roseiarcaceae bacterium H3SJ34-1]